MDNNLFGTSSLLLASWVLYAGRNPFVAFRDGKFWFADGEHTIQFLIAGYHDADPRANIHEFEKARNLLVVERRRSNYGGKP